MEQSTENIYRFGDYEIDRLRRVLRKNGHPVSLKPKTFELLLALTERPGEAISKNELMDRVWENQFVEEKNLSVHIAALRKVFGETKNENRYIATLPGTGYSFVASFEPIAETSVILERERYSRVVIEEEYDVNGDGGERPHARDIAPASRVLTGRRSARFPIGAVAVALLFAVTGGYWLLSKNDLFRRSSSRFSAAEMKTTKMTNSGKVHRAALSTDGKLYAYVVSDGEMRSLWLGYSGGGEGIMLRPPARAIYSTPAFSPDGTALYFSVAESDASVYTLYRLPVFGGVAEKMLDNVTSAIAFSPDGRRIAFERSTGGVSKLMVASADGKDEHELAARAAGQSFNENGPSWSPDGRVIAAAAISDDPQKGEEIVGVNAENGRVASLTVGHWDHIGRVTWLKDGSGLLALSGGDGEDPWGIWYVSLPAGTGQKITDDLNSYSRYSLDISADGRTILATTVEQLSNVRIAAASDPDLSKPITSGSSGRYDGLYGLMWMQDSRLLYTARNGDSQSIWIMNADGSQPRQLTPSGYTDAQPSVSGDGRSFIYQSVRGPDTDIYQMQIDGGDPRRLTSGGKNTDPDLSPGGDAVIYCHENALWGLSLESGAPRQLITGQVRGPRFSPDGAMIAVATVRDGKRKVVILPSDGGYEISAFDVPKTANFRNGLRWSPDGKVITYRDWADGIWEQRLDGGEPFRMPKLPTGKVYTYDWSADGKRFAFTPAVEIRDVVMLRDVR